MLLMLLKQSREHVLPCNKIKSEPLKQHFGLNVSDILVKPSKLCEAWAHLIIVITKPLQEPLKYTRSTKTD